MSQLDDNFQEYYQMQFGKPASAAVLKQLKRDLFHAVWMFLMDDEFIHAYVHGFVSTLSDGLQRLSFPRFFTYAMDYPEKSASILIFIEFILITNSEFWWLVSNILLFVHVQTVTSWNQKFISLVRSQIWIQESNHSGLIAITAVGRLNWLVDWSSRELIWSVSGLIRS